MEHTGRPDQSRRLLNGARDLTSAGIHLVGAILSVAGLVALLLIAAFRGGDPWRMASFALYGASLILLYSASTLYHFFYISEKAHQVLRRIDHIMIFVLIAGTYTPISLVSLRGWIGWTVFGVVWGLALLGIVMKVFWMNAPRWLYTLYYILMGWIAIIPIVPLGQSIALRGVSWLLAGGLFYTVGGVCYALKKPNIDWKGFGFHELFHVFILLGSICHYVMMLRYVM